MTLPKGFARENDASTFASVSSMLFGVFGWKARTRVELEKVRRGVMDAAVSEERHAEQADRQVWRAVRLTMLEMVNWRSPIQGS